MIEKKQFIIRAKSMPCNGNLYCDDEMTAHLVEKVLNSYASMPRLFQLMKDLVEAHETQMKTLEVQQ